MATYEWLSAENEPRSESSNSKLLQEVGETPTECSGTPVPTHSGVVEEPSYPEAGMKTSDFYRTKSLPERFNHPDWFEGYNTKSQHPFYATSANVYGSKPPSVHTMPTQFHGRTQKFSETLGKIGMFRNHSLNTALNRSKV